MVVTVGVSTILGSTGRHHGDVEVSNGAGVTVCR
jgi:hypothetical protein